MATYQERVNHLSLDDALELAQNPDGNIAAEGTYGEGGVYTTMGLFYKLKDAVKKGELSLTDYAKAAEPLTNYYTSQIQNLEHQKGGEALAAQLSNQAMRDNLVQLNSDRNAFVSKAPFSRQEFAQLPANVLPTQQDIDKGLISRDYTPFQRVQDPSGGGVDANGNPIPADINLSSDRGQVELEAQRQASQLQTTLDQQKTLRDQNRAELAQLLADRQTDSFNRAIPQLTENANTGGILRSTGFGEQLASKYADLTKDTQFQLAQQGLGDSEKYVGGLGDIANVRAGLQTSGLQREFSLDDASRTSTLAQQLAQLSQPSGSSGKTNGEKWAQGIQTGAQVVGAAAKAKEAF